MHFCRPIPPTLLFHLEHEEGSWEREAIPSALKARHLLYSSSFRCGSQVTVWYRLRKSMSTAWKTCKGLAANTFKIKNGEHVKKQRV